MEEQIEEDKPPPGPPQINSAVARQKTGPREQVNRGRLPHLVPEFLVKLSKERNGVVKQESRSKKTSLILGHLPDVLVNILRMV